MLRTVVEAAELSGAVDWPGGAAYLAGAGDLAVPRCWAGHDLGRRRRHSRHSP